MGSLSVSQLMNVSEGSNVSERHGATRKRGISAGSGAVIAGTVSGMPADRAGLTQGDVITSADGHQISSPSALQTALESHHPGDSVRIGWTDQFGQTHTGSLTLMSGPPA